ncbi:uncharacterized protein F5Z01DRAFT_494856 [Emericellopsis atlantica]|uniref:Secreted protein n=1 Tax=Emericellopsis atlantica TaxID=2614577 RepID=A0A9P7ZD32_9HYPO|nr:uncharacterized protein F5Z01DRAFT_494856 [Emericellopsis atlantica]KAG9249531.1 hypothetical protein F5Z01DRAFT_494856 [Emericellopsis atlantica]
MMTSGVAMLSAECWMLSALMIRGAFSAAAAGVRRVKGACDNCCLWRRKAIEKPKRSTRDEKELTQSDSQRTNWLKEQVMTGLVVGGYEAGEG